MPPVRNAQVLFKQIPADFPEPGKTVVYDESETIDLDTVILKGGILVKTLVLSIDPYMRGRMRPADVKSYTPAFTLNEPLDGFGVGLVLRSENSRFKHGDHVYGPSMQHKEYVVLDNLSPLRIIENKEKLPWSTYLGAAGMPGKTAYIGWKEYSKAKKGETAFITAGGGPVGSMVIQLAKQDGVKVISSAGSEEKVNFMKDVGSDFAFNYKTTDTEEVLKKNGPVDVYWDNVGGETLDITLKYSNVFGRFIECGMISGYNTRTKPLENIFFVLERSLTMQGFIVLNLEHKYEDEFYRTIPPKLASGEIKHKEEVHRGLEKVGEVLLSVQKGTNKAKTVVLVADG